MPYGTKDYAECPRCGKTAYSEDEIDVLFGYRDMGNNKIIPQSHCKECRSEEARERR